MLFTRLFGLQAYLIWRDLRALLVGFLIVMGIVGIAIGLAIASAIDCTVASNAEPAEHARCIHTGSKAGFFWLEDHE
jgi:uncharacterized membrane protein